MLTRAQLVLSKAFGCMLIALSIGMLVFVAAECAGAFGRAVDVTGLVFVGSAFLAIPFVVTYTKLGLNPGEDETTPEIDRRQKSLDVACPWWGPSWYVCLGIVLLSWIVGALLQLRVDWFVVFDAMLLMLSGTWFTSVFPVAHRLFASEHRSMDDSVDR